MKVLGIIPCYNEESNIKQLINELSAYSDQLDIIIINDCSKDKTSQLCKEENVNVIDLPCNLGIGGAVQTGYLYAKAKAYDIAVQIDGDGQHDPSYISELISPLVKGEADFSIGTRFLKREGFQSSGIRRVGIVYFSMLLRMLTKTQVSDPTSGFRACNKKIINFFAENYPTDYPEPESIMALSRNGYRITEVPVKMRERNGGKSSIRAFKSFYYMIKVTIAIVIDSTRKKQIN
ncbi:glycosyl transferase family 2 [Paenibacillus durus ATCC 35681]|uniref:Glycosyl transferase family 2 n=1 Tax=Paenibacillus durus ATCC 35681 TaxID=1333534 RepID=A0A0F7FCH6_PAEDU|nr:glycosyltransferase family 2 protein [Paenibacillus durus]AKG36510.1 glycosyl transferase family 2 [Paenibacillus durus ATCC 35681]